MGGGFLYTNKESISLGVVVGMDAMRKRRRRARVLAAARRVQGAAADQAAGRRRHGGRVLGARDPRGRHRQVPRLAGDGYLVAGDAAGLSLNALVTVRGMDFAIASGYYAAQAVLEAREAGDFSAAGLAGYEASLRDSFVLKDLETARAIPQFMENPRLFTHYPPAVSRLLEQRLHGRARAASDGLVKTAWKGVAPRLPERGDRSRTPGRCGRSERGGA